MKKREKLKGVINSNQLQKKPINLSQNTGVNFPVNPTLVANAIFETLNPNGLSPGPLNSFACNWTGYDPWSGCNYLHCSDAVTGSVMDLANCDGKWYVMRYCE
jgi:hypothetical protein